MTAGARAEAAAAAYLGLTGLAWHTSDVDVASAVRKAEVEVESVAIGHERRSGKSNGRALLTFADTEQRDKALSGASFGDGVRVEKVDRAAAPGYTEPPKVMHPPAHAPPPFPLGMPMPPPGLAHLPPPGMPHLPPPGLVQMMWRAGANASKGGHPPPNGRAPPHVPPHAPPGMSAAPPLQGPKGDDYRERERGSRRRSRSPARRRSRSPTYRSGSRRRSPSPERSKRRRDESYERERPRRSRRRSRSRSRSRSPRRRSRSPRRDRERDRERHRDRDRARSPQREGGARSPQRVDGTGRAGEKERGGEAGAAAGDKPFAERNERTRAERSPPRDVDNDDKLSSATGGGGRSRRRRGGRNKKRGAGASGDGENAKKRSRR